MYQKLFSGNLKRVVLISAIVQSIALCIFLFTFVKQQKIIRESVFDKFTANVEYLENEMLWSAECLSNMTADTATYQSVVKSREIDKIKKTAENRRIFYMLRTISGRNYNFFLYSQANDRFVELTTVEIPFQEYLPIRNYLKAHLNTGTEGLWSLADVNTGSIVYYFQKYGDFYMGTWIRESDLLVRSNAKGEYTVKLLSKEDSTAKTGGPFPFVEETLSYALSPYATNFTLQLTIPADYGLVSLAIVEMFQLMLWLEVLVVLAYFAAVINKKLLKPMRNLSGILQKYKDTNTPASKPALDTDYDIRQTMDDAYAIVDTLGHQVDVLSAELYEKELAVKKVELNFRNLQIRPHFMINCFAMISGMAQINDTEEIKKVLVYLSDYFRYVLHDCMDMVTLDEETEHIHCLVQIRTRINHNRIVFEDMISEDVRSERVPVLLLATLAENAIRCAYGDDKEIRIRLRAEAYDADGQHQDNLRLVFTDNGPGMKAALMEEINSGHWDYESKGAHIGLSNMLKRLELIYGGRATVRFSRDQGDLGGTCVIICIRQVRQQHEITGCGR